MKGVTPIIAIVLLIIIVIAMISALAINFQTLFQSTSDTAREQAQETTDRLAQTIRIESVSGDEVTIRGTGKIFETKKVAMFIEGVLTTCNWDKVSISLDKLATCILDNACAAGSVLKATSPGNAVSVVC